jgi:hypothetical protein
MSELDHSRRFRRVHATSGYHPNLTVRIGTNSIVGAGAVITEGKTFAGNSLVVGAPALGFSLLFYCTLPPRYALRTRSSSRSATHEPLAMIMPVCRT